VTTPVAAVAPPVARPVRPPFAWSPVLAVAGPVTVALLALANRYDYHRDELYFRLLRGHPAWGYVDQPPLTPMVARLATALLGDSLWAMRVPAALCAVATAVLVALIAREVGGGRAAQALAASAAGTGFLLIAGHVLVTATIDIVVWPAVILLVMRALLRAEPRWWLGAGTVVGLGLYNKLLVVLLLLGIGIGLLLVGPRRVLRSPWLWAGVALALVLGAPNLVYQATHDWPQLSMAQALASNKGDDARANFVPLQLLMLGPPVVAVWIAGLVKLLRDPALRPVRAIGVGYLALCVIVPVTAGQPYYTLGLQLALWAVGSVATVNWIGGRAGRRALVLAAVALNAAVGALIALPILPVPVLARTPIPAVNQVTRDQIGWPAYVAQVAAAYRTLSPDEAAHAVIIAGNYGQAGALDRYGGRYGLPKVYSGQNELYHLARPPESATVAILLGLDRYARTYFDSCQVAGRFDNGVGIDNEEQGRAIWVCRGLKGTWARLWPDFQHFD
jgi:hypothetical protein